MKLFEAFLDRRSGKTLPLFQRFEYLKRYIHPDYFIRFADIPDKITPNPLYNWAVYGTYAYPAMHLDKLSYFGQERDWIQVIKLTDRSKIIVLNWLQNPQSVLDSLEMEDWLEKQMADPRMEEWIRKTIALGKSILGLRYEQFGEFARGAQYAYNSRYAFLINIGTMARIWGGVKHGTLMKFYQAMGIDGFIDNGTGTISSDIPYQAAFFRTDILQIVETIPNHQDIDKIRTGKASRLKKELEDILNDRHSKAHHPIVRDYLYALSNVKDETSLKKLLTQISNYLDRY